MNFNAPNNKNYKCAYYLKVKHIKIEIIYKFLKT